MTMARKAIVTAGTTSGAIAIHASTSAPSTVSHGMVCTDETDASGSGGRGCQDVDVVKSCLAKQPAVNAACQTESIVVIGGGRKQRTKQPQHKKTDHDFAEEISHRRSQVNPREDGTPAEKENLLGRRNSPVTKESPV